MSVIAEFTVPSEEFALHETLVSVPEMIVEVERVVSHGDDRIMPFFWTRGGDYEEFEAAAASDPSIEALTQLDELNEAVLYRAEWGMQNVETVVYAYKETGATVLTAIGRNERWELQMRFDDDASLSRFRAYLDENDMNFHLDRLYNPTEPTSSGQSSLTAAQRETLTTALNAGYYDLPRETSMDELVDALDVSQQALSKRFRRGHRNLIRDSLTVSSPERDDQS